MNCCIEHRKFLLLLLQVLFIFHLVMIPGYRGIDDLMMSKSNVNQSLRLEEVGKVVLEPIGRTEYKAAIELDAARQGGSRRGLAPFQLCLVCKCCILASDPSTCATMPCCFGIDCQLPNKPYGVCAFVPKSCNCTSCAV